MPIITQLTAQKRGAYVHLYVDDEFVCCLTLTQVAAHRLYRGKELTAGTISALHNEATASRAYVVALRYLGLRIRSVEEIREYLKRKGYEAYVESTIHRLERERYLNDAEFAQRWWTMRAKQSRSPQSIQAELAKKGIARDIIAVVTQSESPDRSVESIIHLAEKKQRHRSIEREKLIAYLAGRGFCYDDIRRAMALRPNLFSRLS